MLSKKIRKIAASMALFGFLLVASGNVLGYGFFDYFDGSVIRTEHWANTTNITWSLNDQTPEFQSPSAASFAAWENVSYTDVTFQYAGLTPIVFDAQDGTNLLSYAAPYINFRQGVLGFTVNYITNSTGVINESDIIMSDAARWSTDGTPKNQEYELGAVLTHEIGHHQGLAHSVVASATMYPFISKGDAGPATLEDDDLISHALQYNNGTFPGSAYSTFSGSVTRGGSGNTVSGACVHSFPTTAEFYADNITNTFSDQSGDYTLYVPSSSTYLVRLDPLDGDPAAFDPGRINLVLIATAETNFPAEWWDSGENNCEDATAATSLTIGAGASVTGINFVTNENCSGGTTDTMHVASIAMSEQAGNGNRFRGVATVTIVNQTGGAVSGASVTGTFELDGVTQDTKNGTTDGSGQTTISAKWIKNGTGDWCFEVTNVTLAGAVYDASANAVTKQCESGFVFASDPEGGQTRLSSIPTSARLEQNYPNPFNPSTEISYSLREAATVSLEVFNVLGRRVTAIEEGTREAGIHRVTWNGTNGQGQAVSSGIYFYRLTVGEDILTRKMILLK